MIWCCVWMSYDPCHGHCKPNLTHAKPWEETSQCRINARSSPLLLDPFWQVSYIIVLVWSHPLPKPISLYFDFWPCAFLSYLAGMLIPMLGSSKHNKSQQSAEKTCKAVHSVIFIFQMRKSRGRWQKISCFQPKALLTTVLTSKQDMMGCCEGGQKGQVDTSSSFVL